MFPIWSISPDLDLAKTTRAWDDTLHERDGEWGYRFENGAPTRKSS